MMKKIVLSLLISITFVSVAAQNVMTPEILLQLNKVSGKGISKDGKSIVYSVSKYNKDLSNSNTVFYSIPIEGGKAEVIKDYKSIIPNKNMSPNELYVISTLKK